MTTASASDRNYPALFLAIDDVLEGLGDGAPDADALRRSFEDSADGFGAQKAILLRVVPGAAPPLQSLASRGLSWVEVEACESGLSVPGVSSSCIREALEKRLPVLIQDPNGALGAEVSEVLKLQPCSVLVAPVCHPRTREPLAVLYVQNEGLRHAFGEIDRAWIEVYARTLGRVLAR